MKKFLSVIIIGLLCSLPSLYADDEDYTNPDQQIEKMIKKFESKGGSKDGAKVFKEELSKIDKQALAESNQKMLELRKEIKDIATASTFDATAFKDKVGELHILMAERMTKMLNAQVDILSKLNKKDREIYINKIYEKMARMHGKMHKMEESDD